MGRSTFEARLALASGISVAITTGLFAALSKAGATLFLAALLSLAAGFLTAG